MTSVSEIQQAILTLGENDYRDLLRWITELDWQRWDAQIEADSKSGKLDFLKSEALASKIEGTVDEL